MLLSDLFTSLSYGVLSNLAIGGEGSGTIPVAHENRLVDHTNQSLLAIYGRLPILEKEVAIRAYDGMTIYPLKKKFADTDPTVVPQKFISDTLTDPFLEDVIRVLSVWDEEGEEVPLNDPDDEASLYLPAPTTLQIPQPVTGNAYFVLYQARHPLLVQDDLTQELTLPEVLHDALMHHIAYKVLSPMNGQEHAAKAGEHLQTYEMIVSRIEQDNLLGTSLLNGNTKLHERGFI